VKTKKEKINLSNRFINYLGKFLKSLKKIPVEIILDKK
jgi:hypothetical protein